MKILGYVVLVYSLIVLSGGMVGYALANSIVSLAMGTIFAMTLLGSGMLMLKGSVKGHYSALVLTLTLAAFFSYRYYTTLKVMPAGMMAGISLVLVALLLYGLCCCTKAKQCK